MAEILILHQVYKDVASYDLEINFMKEIMSTK